MSTPRRGLVVARKATTAEWAAYLEPLDAGRLGQDTDTGELRVGDGTSLWADLGGVGGAAGTVDRFVLAVAFDTPNLTEGVPLGDLAVGDVVLTAAFACTATWDGTTPDAKILIEGDDPLVDYLDFDLSGGVDVATGSWAEVKGWDYHPKPRRVTTAGTLLARVDNGALGGDPGSTQGAGVFYVLVLRAP